MLVINYNGNKPTTDYFKFSVQGNNNADVVRFCLEKKQGKIDLSGYKVYVQAYCEEDDFIDKVEITDNVNIVDNQLSADWTLLKKHTVNRQLQVSLSFEDLDNEVVWQTQIVKITIANGINADEEMINSYPTIIEQMQGEIEEVQQEVETLKNKPSKNFVIQKNNTLIFKKDVRCLITIPNRKPSKGIVDKYYGTKKGNYLTNIVFSKNDGLYLEDILRDVLASAYSSGHYLTKYSIRINELFQYFDKASRQQDTSDNETNAYVDVYENDTPMDYELVTSQHAPRRKIVLDPSYKLWYRKMILRPLKRLEFGKRTYENGELKYRRTWDKAYTRFMIKFVADYQEHTIAKDKTYWTGIMANVWLEVDVMVRKQSDGTYEYFKVSLKTFK